jgi:hypothetical protein
MGIWVRGITTLARTRGEDAERLSDCDGGVAPGGVRVAVSHRVDCRLYKVQMQQIEKHR